MIYKDKSVFDELLNRDSSISIHHQNIKKLDIEMFKFAKGLSPEIMKETFQFSEEFHYQLRTKGSLYILLVPTFFNGKESIRFLVRKIWKIIPNE